MSRSERITEIAQGFGTIVLFGMIGIFFAIMFSVMNDNSIILDEIVTSTLTISDIMFAVFIFWTILGLFLNFIRKK